MKVLRRRWEVKERAEEIKWQKGEDKERKGDHVGRRTWEKEGLGGLCLEAGAV